MAERPSCIFYVCIMYILAVFILSHLNIPFATSDNTETNMFKIYPFVQLVLSFRSFRHFSSSFRKPGTLLNTLKFSACYLIPFCSMHIHDLWLLALRSPQFQNLFSSTVLLITWFCVCLRWSRLLRAMAMHEKRPAPGPFGWARQRFVIMYPYTFETSIMHSCTNSP